jgi:outer membrane receptor protein involved in Fe transport
VVASIYVSLLAAAVAQEEPANRDVIVVTGERVPRSLRETASSVDVASADRIEAMSGADRIEQLLEQIPNVLSANGGLGPTIRGQDTTGAMRDLPAFLGGNRPRTTLVIDGRAVSFNEFIFGVAPLWDVERVELFRTPQTTTQGRNSIAGAIFIYSQDPTATWEATARGIVGDLRTRQLSASASGPILEHGLAFRISGDWRKSQPASRIADNMRGAAPDHDEYGLLRVKLLAEPEALPGSRLELTYAHTRSQMPQIEGVAAPFRERRDPFAGYGIFRTNIDSLTGAFDYDPTPELSSRTVVSFGNARIRRFAPPGFGETRIGTDDWSAETIVNWKPDERIRLTGGTSYVQAKLDQFINLSGLSGIGEFDDTQKSWGLFGEASWRFVPRAEITAGLRYQHDRQVRTGALASQSGDIPLNYQRSFDAWLPKLSLSYEFSDRLLAGVLVQRAYNPGGATLRFDTGTLDEIQSEKLWNYELFVRASLGRLKTRFNLFREDLRDTQRSAPIVIIAPEGFPVTFADLFNVKKARTQGAEAELDWSATGRLSVRGAIGLLDTRIIDAGPLHGKEFPRAPHFTGSLALDWRPRDAIRLSAQLRHNSGYFSNDPNSPELRIGGSTTVDARASWDVGRLTLFGYARNLFDEFHMNYLFSPTFGTAGEPREVGVGIEARF